jgi:A/G-specific adenine glycosylase
LPDFPVRKLLDWFERCGRHDLPWQKHPTPYRVWVSEIMLQQTQVQTVIPYYEAFMERYPDIFSLASATLDEVLSGWAGLGYYARCRNLHKSASQIVMEYGGQFPDDIQRLMALPGIGRSTAGAILSLSTGQRHAILDGNVRRVLCRYAAIEEWPGEKATEKRLWALAEAFTPCKRVKEYNQAMMDLGATVCKRGKPECTACPLNAECQALKTGKADQLPCPRPAKRVPVKRQTLLEIFSAEGAILLARQPVPGIWGGLWSLPVAPEAWQGEVSCHDGEGDLSFDVAGIPFYPQVCKRVGSFSHLFSHFKLEAEVYGCQLALPADRLLQNRQTDFMFYSLKENSQLPALPAPIKKWIHGRYPMDLI